MADRGIIEVPDRELLIPQKSPAYNKAAAYLDKLLEGRAEDAPPLEITGSAVVKALGIGYSALYDAMRGRKNVVIKTRHKEGNADAAQERVSPLNHPKAAIVRARLEPIAEALSRGDPDTFASAKAISRELGIPPQVVDAIARDMGITNRNPAHPESPEKTNVKNKLDQALALQDLDKPVKISARAIAREAGVSVRLANDTVNEALAERGLTRDDTQEEHPERQGIMNELGERARRAAQGEDTSDFSYRKIAARHGAVSPGYVEKLEKIRRNESENKQKE
jgi:hypothetical protein